MTPLATAVYEQPWFKAVLYLAIAVVVARVADYLLRRRDRAVQKLLGRSPDSSDHTRYVMIRRLIVAAILFVGVAIALLQFQAVNSVAQAMLASAAIFAAVIGIAARAPLANLVSGVMIAFSQPVRLNDYIRIGDTYGIVERISLTYTFIRTADDRRVVIPNESFASQAVHNYSLESPASMLAVDITVPAGVDLESLCAGLKRTADELAPAPEGKHNSVEVTGIGPSGTGIRLHAWAPLPQQRRALASDLRLAVHRKLVADGVLAAGREASGAG